jgi:GGDEF domain-containing protein
VAQLVNRKLSKIMATKLRKEDTVAELAPARFAVVSPATSMNGAAGFALRLQNAIDHIVMTYREERIRIRLTVGIATSVPARQTVSHLIGVAVQRLAQGRRPAATASWARARSRRHARRCRRPPVSIDQLLQQLAGNRADAGLARNSPMRSGPSCRSWN